MKNTLSEFGKISGKSLYRSPVKNVDESELKLFFSTFNFEKLAFIITDLATKLFNEGAPQNLNGTGYNDDFLCRAYELAIKYASINDGKIPTDEDLVDILQYAAGEAEKYHFSGISHDPSCMNPIDAEIMMTRIAYTQFFEDEFNLIARYWYIFAYLWKEYSSTISPLDDIKEIVGASYREIIIYGLLLCSMNFRHCLSTEEKKEISVFLKDDFSDEGFENFLKFFSCDQNEWSCDANTPPPICILKPIVRMVQKCSSRNEIFYCVPAKYRLMQRVTSGLYFDLCNKYNRGGGDNPFKNEFGIVFERYIEIILKDSLTSYDISPEIVYNKKGEKSVDFFVKRDNTLVLIEVKQSSIFWKSKVSGAESDLLSDLRKTVLNAANQINRTRTLIESKKCEPFSDYYNCSQKIGLIVVNDPLYNANDLCRRIISNAGQNVDGIYIINVSDLELFLDLQKAKQNFWEVLDSKKNGYENYDFKEYLNSQYIFPSEKKGFLKKYYDEVVSTAPLFEEFFLSETEIKENGRILRQEIEKYVTPISKVIDYETGVHWGTGSFFEKNGKRFIITNEHVAAGRNDHSLAYHFLNTDEYKLIQGIFASAEFPYDVAIAQILEDHWNRFHGNSECIPFARFASKFEAIPNECFFLEGFSGQRACFHFGYLNTPATPLLTYQTRLPDWFSPQAHFALVYDRNNFSYSDEKMDLPEPGGMSGSLVWNTKLVECKLLGQAWTVETPVVVGIIHRYLSDLQVLIGTKIEYMRIDDLIKYACGEYRADAK